MKKKSRASSVRHNTALKSVLLIILYRIICTLFLMQVGFTLSKRGQIKLEIFWLGKPCIEREFYAHEYKTGSREEGWGMLFRELNGESAGHQTGCDQTSVQLAYKDIGASRVSMKEVGREYIVTRPPTERTVTQFWQMVWEQHSVGIVMLCKFVEDDEEDEKCVCASYWPGVGGEPMIAGSYVVECTNCDWKEHYCRSTLRLYNLDTEETFSVIHFHYFTWADVGSVPENAQALAQFMGDVQESGVVQPGVGPLVVHGGSTETSRSGVFCVADSCVSWAENSRSLESVDVSRVLLEARRQRPGFIDSSDELRLTYMTILNAAHYGLGLGQGIAALHREVVDFTETLTDQAMRPAWFALTDEEVEAPSMSLPNISTPLALITQPLPLQPHLTPPSLFSLSSYPSDLGKSNMPSFVELSHENSHIYLSLKL